MRRTLSPEAATGVREKPGWGIEVDEKAAAKFPSGDPPGGRSRLDGGWSGVRLPGGTVNKQ